MTDKENENWVDSLLKTDPPLLPEKDFCKSILTSVRRNKLQRLVVLTSFYALAIGVIVIYFPTYDFLHLPGLGSTSVILGLVFFLVLKLLTEIRKN